MATSGSATATWVPQEWLAAQPGPNYWGTLLFWKLNEGNLTRIDSQRALANGLVIRPLLATLADTLKWYNQQPEEVRSKVNAGFQRDPNTGNFAKTLVTWSGYLQRERQVLAAWHGERAANGAAAAIP